MIDPAVLPSWEGLFSRLGLKPPRRGRAACPLCKASNPSTLSLDEDRGFHCFKCGVHGDKIAFVMKLEGWEFKDALRFFGFEPGRPPVPDPAFLQQRKHEAQMEELLHQQCKREREEFRIRGQVILRAHDRLLHDSEDCWAWSWLRWCYTGLDAIEHFLDECDLVRPPYHRAWRRAA